MSTDDDDCSFKVRHMIIISDTKLAADTLIASGPSLAHSALLAQKFRWTNTTITVNVNTIEVCRTSQQQCLSQVEGGVLSESHLVPSMGLRTPGYGALFALSG